MMWDGVSDVELLRFRPTLPENGDSQYDEDAYSIQLDGNSHSVNIYRYNSRSNGIPQIGFSFFSDGFASSCEFIPGYGLSEVVLVSERVDIDAGAPFRNSLWGVGANLLVEDASDAARDGPDGETTSTFNTVDRSDVWYWQQGRNLDASSLSTSPWGAGKESSR